MLGDVEHVTETDARTWKVRYRAHHISESLEVIGEEREKALFGKLFCRIVSSRVIVEDGGGIIVNGCQIGLDVVSIFAFLVMIIITIAAASTVWQLPVSRFLHSEWAELSDTDGVEED